MIKSLTKKIANWGQYPKVSAQVFTASDIAEVQQLITENSSILARGNGRCYGDAALNETVFSTKKLNHFLAFDKEKGTLTCQAGVLFADILALIIPEGFFLPVTPGTKFITVGGAIAADVHGKNHHKEGCFSEYLIEFELVDADGKLQKCSRKENTNLFWQTIGGMGLTGIIVTATFKLKPIESAYIRLESLKANNLAEIIEHFEASKNWTYTVAWIDCLQNGKHAGRSILLRGEHATLDELPKKWKANPLKVQQKFRINIPFNFPSFTLNYYTIKIFNFLFYHKQFRKVKKSIVDYDSYFYPLDFIHNWNRIYGKNGFTQYQLVIPCSETNQAVLKQILQIIIQYKQGAFLAVLKQFGKANPLAINSFPLEGYTLTLDFKINRKIQDLINALDAIVTQNKGRVYLAKDAFSKPFMQLSYPKNQKFQSLQVQRLSV